MAHFAQINKKKIVTFVTPIDNSKLGDPEDEQKGIEFLRSIFGADTEWVQTSYNATFRKNFAGIGFTWDPARDAFIPPKPEEGNYILNEQTCIWELQN